MQQLDSLAFTGIIYNSLYSEHHRQVHESMRDEGPWSLFVELSWIQRHVRQHRPLTLTSVLNAVPNTHISLARQLVGPAYTHLTYFRQHFFCFENICRYPWLCQKISILVMAYWNYIGQLYIHNLFSVRLMFRWRNIYPRDRHHNSCRHRGLPRCIFLLFGRGECNACIDL